MTDLVRICPSCSSHNPPDQMRCSCGALLFGVDLVRPAPQTDEQDAPAPAPTPATTTAPTPSPAALICPYTDCAQPNPVDATRCLYCNRLLHDADTGTAIGANASTQAPPALLQLPTALRDRYRITEPLTATGMEADILLITPLGPAAAPADTLVAKIYRQGILPSPEVQQRIAQVDPAHCVRLLETGLSDGRAFEVMEYCPLGSLREHMPAGQPLAQPFITSAVRELAAALQAVHAVALVHRDLKPENILLRSSAPLDLVLTDFGTASVVRATQRFTSVARTLLYAAPEALSGIINAKADYWALGMILLEMATGTHPFAGLSDAVVLHHLATRSISLQAVADPRLRQLLRGLLQRDPKRRWAADELHRWLSGDDTLPHISTADAGAEFGQPYKLLGEHCHTPEQLAVALARHWDAGVADIQNGQLLAWFTHVQKDQDAVRLLLQDRSNTPHAADEQLLRLILHFAPGIPPVWRGRSLALRSLLGQVNEALQGNRATAQWLLALYESPALGIWAQSGNAPVAELNTRWRSTAQAFADAWAAQVTRIQAQTTVPPHTVRFDDVVYGRASAPAQPPATWLHPRLLAATYDPAWLARLRQKLSQDLAQLAAQQPWIVDLGHPEQLDAPELLACEALLPHLRQTVQQENERQAQRTQQDADTRAQLMRHLHVSQNQIARQASQLTYLFPQIDALHQALADYTELTTLMRRISATDRSWLQARKAALRNEAVARHMRKLCYRIQERRTANAGWRNENVFSAVAGAFLLAGWIWGVRGLQGVLLLTLALVIWRAGPSLLAIQQIRQLAQRMQIARHP